MFLAILPTLLLVKLKSSYKALAGALFPKDCIPKEIPSEPTYFSKTNILPASIDIFFEFF